MMMSKRSSLRLTVAALALVPLWLALSSQGTAQTLDAGQQALDCTIEPTTMAMIGSADEGILEDIQVERGDHVKKGQVLARLEASRETLAVELARLEAEQDVDVRSRAARLAFLRGEAERTEKLFQRRIVSDQARDEAMVEKEISALDVESATLRRRVAQVELALAEANLERRTIRSPIDGIVTEVSKAAGEYIHEQAPLLSLARIDELNVEVFVPVRRYGEIALNQKAVVEPVQPIGGRYEAVVSVVDRVFDAASGTFGVRLKLDNADEALPAGIRCSVLFLQDAAALD